MISPAESLPATLHGWKLQFSQPGLPFSEPAFAAVEPLEAVPEAAGLPDVHGVAHRITPSQVTARPMPRTRPAVLRWPLTLPCQPLPSHCLPPPPAGLPASLPPPTVELRAGDRGRRGAGRRQRVSRRGSHSGHVRRARGHGCDAHRARPHQGAAAGEAQRACGAGVRGTAASPRCSPGSPARPLPLLLHTLGVSRLRRAATRCRRRAT